MGKASWDARVTGLGPRDVPEKRKKEREAQGYESAASAARFDHAEALLRQIIRVRRNK